MTASISVDLVTQILREPKVVELDSVDAETFLIVVTAPIWFLAFVVLFVAGAVSDWRRRG